MVKAKKYILKSHFNGFPKATDLKLVEEELPELKDGEFLAEAVVLSVDPYMRAFEKSLEIGTTFIGSQVAKIIESKSNKYKKGQYVVGEFGWRTHSISDGCQNVPGFPPPWLVPDLEDLPLSLSLGILGMPGNAAYFGFLDICKPNSNETVVVSGAGGAVGSIVGQIAKIKGCRVIGISGSEQKGKWIVDELNFDEHINYKTDDVQKNLRDFAPKGIDCYFDNIGGEISSTVLRHMNMNGRVAVCGAISGYNSNDNNYPAASMVQGPMILKQLKMEGFHVHRWIDRWMEGIEQNLKWIREKKLKYNETVTRGFENMTEAFLGMLRGENCGKAIVYI